MRIRTNLLLAFLCALLTTAATAQRPATGTSTSIPEYISPGQLTGSTNPTANATKMSSFDLQSSVSATKITYDVTGADNTANTYDFGIYSVSGTLLCHTGATVGTTAAPTIGTHTLSFLAACSLPGSSRYYIAITGDAGTMGVEYAGSLWLAANFANPSSGSATSGGALNSSVTPPADSWATGGIMVFSLHN